MGSIGDFVSRRLLPFLITCGYNGPSRKAPGGPMDKINSVRNRDDVLRLLSAALRHEWAVSFEYVIHAYSMPKGKYFYDDPVLRQGTALSRSPGIERGAFPKVENMVWNISYDEARHIDQFAAMIAAIESAGEAGAGCFRPPPDRETRG